MQPKSLKSTLATFSVTFGFGAVAAFLSPSFKTGAAVFSSAIASAGMAVLNIREDKQNERLLREVKRLATAYANLELKVENLERFYQLQSSNQLVVNPVNSILTSYTPPIIAATGADKLIAELNRLKVNLRLPYKQLEKDDLFDTAIFMGDSYPALALVYRKMKASISGDMQGGFSYKLSGSEDNDEICLRFRAILESKGLWTSKYIKSEKRIRFQPHSGDTKVRSFFEGGWLEKFVVYKICSLLSLHGINFEYLINPHVSYSFEESKYYELDALFLVDNQLILFEVKTGDKSNVYLNQINEHSKRRRLNLSKNRAFLVTLSLTDSETEDWNRNNNNITVVNLNNLTNCFANSLGLVTTEESKIQASIFSTEELYTFLNHKKLRPSPEHRLNVITELVSTIKSLEEPLTFNEIRNKIAEKLQISKALTEEILRAIRRSSCFVNAEGGSISQFTQLSEPIKGLLFEDISVLDSKCIETYASTVVAEYPNYFNSLQNIKIFEETVGAEAPDIETINQLKLRNIN
ncbi:hypothetical protein DSM106972_000010 [Dulcicalothrix desertica PCC 7102]|uniref:NERD domain-containing protein n=1 Tax=Dulcicalothrix desertica PCC 7102 TaxID=232991 RepID=A0A3S1DG70_9CYAN|nr:hypothetical protein [Dulcicalothrix desertica]RUT09507.1 hypothetical protein DSM106972_000010 [Dulcicalothrix desertica PCC 7102]TWH50707.1 hypothetical protein CAL7102_05046 [Dulcicalothrix desertica PCC 7102]